MSLLPQTICPGITNEFLSTGTAAVICSGVDTEARFVPTERRSVDATSRTKTDGDRVKLGTILDPWPSFATGGFDWFLAGECDVGAEP